MTTQISAETLAPITHNQLPVITTELLAQLYGTTSHSITKNHHSNIGRFVCGKHYFKIEGSDLKDFKNKVTNSDLVASRAKHLILWTERGAARHAKMLETDQAWEVFEKLEDCYFSQKCTPSDQKPIIQGDGRTLVIQFDKLGNIITSQEVPNNAWVCTMENFKFFLEQQGWTLINRKKIKSMTVEQLLSLK
ncbi:ORF6N domain-containing protein [Salmonella enterica]|nr:ORF6N domain-containing protein [Salmonella enterica]ECD2093696.1 ORF6N domain-containing protein [Salmonella enterica subsp. enterica serovar Poano]ECD6160852.1 ORF6N domain-containing protein [Salmonella enterica subsp. enterica]ECU7994148.1 ORF6N domain-containing protein [Salmonella enterica subsp. enterica serovar Toucra]EDX3940622.1 ORF6N domain-containing protein [Salmonella enterica subsp. enterica serovar Overschie]EDX6361017.1 ORF6N domain-containing protein [Salmonella enterica s